MGSFHICFITYQAIYPGTFRFTSVFGKSVDFLSFWNIHCMDVPKFRLLSPYDLFHISPSLSLSFFSFFIYLAVLGLSCSMQTLGFSMWDLVP